MSRPPVIGIDPGSRKTGWGIVVPEGRRLLHVEHGIIRLDADAAVAERMMELATRLDDVLVRHAPGSAAIEDVFVSRNPRSALKLGQARGAALAAVARHGLPVSSYPPATVKRAVTGSGKAQKGQVAEMVRAILSLGERPPEDAADALAVAICHARTVR